MIVIYDTLGAYGGSHTLMLRMGKWLNSKNVRMAIICTKASNTEIVEKLKKVNVQIIRANLKDARIGRKVINSLLKIEPIKVFCFIWNYYLDVERIKKKYGFSFDDFVYSIHPDTFKKGMGFKTTFMQEYAKRSYGKILQRMNHGNALIFLDEINIIESEKYLNCKLDDVTPIIRLPMYCTERDDAEYIIEKGYKSNVLLTAARAEFPYKGYLIGLVDLFARQKKKHPEMRLEIVSAGDDIQELRNKINEQNIEVKAAIVLHGWMEYEELKKKMRECRVYIGMGTSILDASLQYKPSIVTAFNTMECISDHFVAEKPTYMTVPPECKESAESRIGQAFDWNFQEYREQCYNSFEKTKEIYDIDICMDRLIKTETTHKDSMLNSYECTRHFLNHQVNKIRFRNVNLFDVQNIEWENK